MLGWLRLPLLCRQSRQTSNIEQTYVQVHSSPSREFVRFKKSFFLAFFRRYRPGVLLLDAAKQLKMGSVCKSFEPSCFENPKYVTLYILTWREKFFFKTWRHPNNFSSYWGSRRRYFKDVTNLKEHLPNVNKIRYCFNFEGMFLACAKRHYLGTACDSSRLDWRHEQRPLGSGLSSNL